VRNKDNSHRFCAHYQAVSKGDSFPLPRIDDLLDDLGRAKCFCTLKLDLASDFWQIPVHEKLQEKAFSTSFELFDFRMMPLGLSSKVCSSDLCSKSWLLVFPATYGASPGWRKLSIVDQIL